MTVMLSSVPINWLAIIAATAFHMVLGYLWYSPTLFAKRWMKELGLTDESMRQAKHDSPSMGTSMAGMTVATLVMMYILRHAAAYAGAADVATGATVGFLAWLGFVATVMLNGIFFERKSWTLYWINAGYYLVSLVVAGAILATWI